LSRLALGAWAALVAAASLVPLPPGPGQAFLFPGSDKVAHALAYAVLCALIVWSTAGVRRGGRLLASAGAAGLFGLLMELLQPLTGRTCDMKDWAADVLGVVAAILAIALVARVLRGAKARTDAAGQQHAR